MRAREFITEDIADVKNTIGNFLAAARGAGMSSIPTKSLLYNLVGERYPVTIDALVTELQDPLYNATATADDITFNDETGDNSDFTQDSGEQVSAMAQNQSAKDSTNPVSDMAQSATNLGS